VEEKTYCDVPNPSNPCHDRRDVSEETGLATCIDGSHEEDWRDCKGGGAEDNDDEDDDNDSNSRDEGDEGGCEDLGGSDPCGEESDQSCGGESCTDDEKEDSWLGEEEEGEGEEDEEEAICYADDNGSLGERVAC
jgi:hypothetical protein